MLNVKESVKESSINMADDTRRAKEGHKKQKHET